MTKLHPPPICLTLYVCLFLSKLQYKHHVHFLSSLFLTHPPLGSIKRGRRVKEEDCRLLSTYSHASNTLIKHRESQSSVWKTEIGRWGLGHRRPNREATRQLNTVLLLLATSSRFPKAFFTAGVCVCVSEGALC